MKIFIEMKMFQRIYIRIFFIKLFQSRIYMKFYAIFAPYLDVDAYIYFN